MAEDALLTKYETQAIVIEIEEKRRQFKQETEGETVFWGKMKKILDRLDAIAADRHQAVSAAITALQESVDKIASRGKTI